MMAERGLPVAHTTIMRWVRASLTKHWTALHLSSRHFCTSLDYTSWLVGSPQERG
jgi:transposase-like protein